MATDLKPMLTKVLGSGGEKKYYFAYGVGKRKDGKGDGELAVRGQKPKKTEIEGELAACNEVHEGICWVGKDPDSNGTVYFQGKGKKLSPMVVAKMALTAKRTTGLQYDFQVPSPEEEARVAKLAEEEGNEGLAAQAAESTTTDTSEATPGNLEAAYQERVKALTDGLKKALTSGTAAGNEAKLRFSESQLLSRKKDFPQAMALLNVVEEQIKKALAGANGAMGSEPAAKTTADDQTAEWKAKLAEWSSAIKAAITAKGPNAAAIGKLLAQATALSKPGGDMVQAIAKLTECHTLATSGTSTGGDPAAEWKAKLAEWSPAIKTAMMAKGPNAAAMVKLFAQATALSKPGGDMDQALAKLAECHALATSDTSASGDPTAEWKAKLTEWSPAIKTTMTAKGPNAAAIGKLLAQATALSKPGGDMVQAIAKLTECHALATSDAGATPAQAAETAPPAEGHPEGAAKPAGDEKKEDASGVFDYAKARGEWVAARGQAQVELKKLKTSILKTFADQPEMPEITQKIDDLDAVLEDLDGGLEEALDEASKANETARQKLHKGVALRIRQHLAYLKGHQMLNEIDANPFQEVRVRKVLTAFLKKLSREISG